MFSAGAGIDEMGEDGPWNRKNQNMQNRMGERDFGDEGDWMMMDLMDQINKTAESIKMNLYL